jgi:uncharacterized membrane protein YcaP (DUF421 family)
MNKEEIQPWDWQRILFGNSPALFMLEVVIRTIIMLLLLLIVMHLLGKKMSAAAGTLELSIIITLGAIVSVPLQIPERGILPSAIILFCVIVFYRLLSWLNFKSKKSEVLTIGNISLIIHDGIINLDELRKAALSHEQLFTQLRNKKIKSLGEVRRTYLEPGGSFSIIRESPPRPGLSVLPMADLELYEKTGRTRDFKSCTSCGFTRDAGNEPEKNIDCPVCGINNWDFSLFHEGKNKDGTSGF